MRIESEIKNEKEKLSSMKAGEKWQYFKDYYMKAVIIVLVLAVIAVVAGRDIIRGRRPSAFYGVIVNNYTNVPDSFKNDFIEYSGINDNKYNVTIDSTMIINLDNLDEMSRIYMQEIMALASTKKQDVFLADEQVVRYYFENKYIVDLREYLGDDFLSGYNEQIYYYEDEKGTKIPAGIYAAGSRILEKYNMFENQQPIISVVNEAPDIENIKKFIEFICES